MKKTFLIFIGVLIGIFVILSAFNMRNEYSAERKIWRINQEFTRLAGLTEAVPDQAYDKLARRYQSFIKNYPTSRLTPRAQILLGRVYLMKKDYETARREFSKVFENYPDDIVLGAEATSVIGKSYELQGEWEQALKTYKSILKDYALTNVALSVPLYIAQYYQSQGETVKAQQAFDEAVVYYNQLANDYPLSEAEFKALRLLSICYLAQKKWGETVYVMEQLLLKFPAPKVASQSIAAINNISITQLKNYDLPIQIYRNFLEKHPEHPLSGAVKEMIQAFEKLKNENVVIQINESK